MLQVLTILVIAISPALADNTHELKVCTLPAVAGDVRPDIAPPAAPEGTDAWWVGTVRVFLVERISRWTDAVGFRYANALIDFPLVSNVNLLDGGKRYFTAEWDVTDASYLYPQSIASNNIAAIGVAFNVTEVPTPAEPPGSYWFSARYADAAASATPGMPGRNQAIGGFTHTVFLEESTATW